VKCLLVDVNVVSTSLKHAYNVHPYSNTLRTKAFTSISLALTLVIPIILQLERRELKLRLAAFSLAYKILSGYILQLFNTIPKYLNYYTVSISKLLIFIYP
jgi:hypothetical protein